MLGSLRTNGFDQGGRISRRGKGQGGAHRSHDARKPQVLHLRLPAAAEREGFEPSVQVDPVRQFSKLLVSATHPPLQ